MAVPDPEYAPRADAELLKLRRIDRQVLRVRLHRLVTGQVDPKDIRLLLGAPQDPPWQWTRFVGSIVVVFRFLSEMELQQRGRSEPQILVARIVEQAFLEQVAKDLLRDAP
jgi:hypothetical protein